MAQSIWKVSVFFIKTTFYAKRFLICSYNLNKPWNQFQCGLQIAKYCSVIYYLILFVVKGPLLANKDNIFKHMCLLIFNKNSMSKNIYIVFVLNNLILFIQSSCSVKILLLSTYRDIWKHLETGSFFKKDTWPGCIKCNSI